jgi:hypothetical protein
MVESFIHYKLVVPRHKGLLRFVLLGKVVKTCLNGEYDKHVYNRFDSLENVSKESYMCTHSSIVWSYVVVCHHHKDSQDIAKLKIKEKNSLYLKDHVKASVFNILYSRKYKFKLIT